MRKKGNQHEMQKHAGNFYIRLIVTHRYFTFLGAYEINMQVKWCVVQGEANLLCSRSVNGSDHIILLLFLTRFESNPIKFGSF
jgi:hypothetical protein